MTTVWCPVCDNAAELPVPEWDRDDGVTEEICSDCELELYGDESSAP